MSMRVHVSLVLAVAFAASSVGAAPAHDVEFWRGIVRDHYKAPEGSDLPALSGELVDMLASPDPEQRDEIGYSTLASWIYQQKVLDGAVLRQIIDRLRANLTLGIGERETDSVLGRSFSALVLSVVVARDNVDPFLDAASWRQIEASAFTYLAAEQDLRGYDPARGWMHSAAHTADLLKFLARSRYVDVAGQRRYLDAIAAKLTAAAVVFTHGEDERYARAVLSLTARRNFDAPQFEAWLQGVKPPVPPHPTVAQLRAAQNWKNLLAKLEVLLSNEPVLSEPATAARTSLRAALKSLF
jgi:hypothetical protein